MIQYQILRLNIARNVVGTIERINNEILANIGGGRVELYMDALKRKVIVESQLVRTVKHYRLGHKFEAVGQKTDAKTTLNSSTPNSL